MSLTVYSLTHKSDIKVSALIDPSKVSSGSVHPVTKSYKVGTGAPSAYKGHNGLDMCGKDGSNIYSVTDGVVRVNTYEKNGAGYYVSIGKQIDGKTYCFLYMHLKEKSNLKVGQKISKGDLIGKQGSTGNSTGSHLHLGVKIKETQKYCDPYYWAIKQEGYDMTYSTGKYNVKATNLRVRNKPTTDGNNIGIVSKGDNFNITTIHMDSDNGTWGLIGENQWICLETIGGDVYAEKVGEFFEDTDSEDYKAKIQGLEDKINAAQELIKQASDALD